jgi:hypothetical protein
MNSIMKRGRIALAIATLLVVGSASLSANAQAPITNYFTHLYITQVTQVSGNLCSFSADTDLYAQLEITGWGQSVTFVFTQPRDAQGLPFSSIFYLPPTPKGSSISWTGTYTRINLPGGTLVGPFPFNGSLQATTALTFIGTMTLTDLPFGNGSSSCTVSLQFSSAFTGERFTGERHDQ